MAAATPPGRDRVVDLLRGTSLAVVVVGHTLMAVVVWNRGVPRVDNLLRLVPELEPLTWVLQVIPVFFAAGAIANRSSLNAAMVRQEPWRIWTWARTRRLARPVLYYLVIWIPIVFVLSSVMDAAARPLERLSTQLLWFLGVYVLIVATTALQVRVARGGLWSVGALVLLVAGVDAGRFHGGGDAVASLNFFLVFFLAAVVGLVVRDLEGPRRRLLWLVAAGAVAVNLALVARGPYPSSMVGLPGEEISNVGPPTLVLGLHAVALIAVIGALWPVLDALCHRVRVWHAACALGGVAMTLYLWHLTALIGVIVTQHALGLDRPPVGDVWFWPTTLVELTVCLVAVVTVVSLAAPLEYLPVPWLEWPQVPAPDRAWRTAAGQAGVVLLAVGFLVLAATGMAGFPWSRSRMYAGVALTPGLGIILVVLGMLAARAAGRPLQPKSELVAD
ncbi:MAG: acyltransferase [Acidimicrobiia bacterium]|nr:acyltransferase [Acidimicrobiia bacterium]